MSTASTTPSLTSPIHANNDATTTPAPTPTTTVDESLFEDTLRVHGLRVPMPHLATVRGLFKGSILTLPRIKAIQPDIEHSDDNTKILLLAQNITKIEDLPEKHQAVVRERSLEFVPYNIRIGFDELTTDQILKKLLPDEKEIVTSFETVGHIAHMNIRDHLLPHKHVIAQVILRKNPIIRTVVNKLNSISSKFREFSMELLAGDDDMKATVVEHGFAFRLDYSKVYWNSRLHTEHQRLVHLLKPSDIVCDMFAGVGPFAVPAAGKGCKVFANDLNPHSYAYLCENAKRNKVQNLIHTYNLDGRDFIRKIFQEQNIPVDHVIMNLPGSAPEFLDVFRGIFANRTGVDSNESSNKLPLIHCYCFLAPSENMIPDAVQCVSSFLGYAGEVPELSVHEVRDVAPNKMMLCVSFRLPDTTARTLPPTPALLPEESSKIAIEEDLSKQHDHHDNDDEDSRHPKRQKC
eukprot:c12841_g1_i1.p1 GENE.c12841_g1_i1~~c12841_g1_i1.p1  ORF type:complete len:525 (-),score=131.02 c12841_g1_i1:87-1472(-)